MHATGLDDLGERTYRGCVASMKLQLAIFSLFLSGAASVALADALRIQASPVLGQALISMASPLRDAGVELKIYNEASSSATIAALVTNQADVIATVRGLTGADRASAPEKLFQQYPVGLQAIAVLVSPEIWASGVRVLGKEQLRGIYQRDIQNWKEVGGPDQAIKFYSYEKGKGVWEQFANWAYGDLRKAPLPKGEIVVNGEDASNTVAFNSGAITLAAPRWADGRSAFALAIKDDAGVPIEPTVANFSSRRYPLVRQIYVIYAERPTGTRLRFLEYLLSAPAQEILRKNDLTPIVDVSAE